MFVQSKFVMLVYQYNFCKDIFCSDILALATVVRCDSIYLFIYQLYETNFISLFIYLGITYFLGSSVRKEKHPSIIKHQNNSLKHFL